MTISHFSTDEAGRPYGLSTEVCYSIIWEHPPLLGADPGEVAGAVADWLEYLLEHGRGNNQTRAAIKLLRKAEELLEIRL